MKDKILNFLLILCIITIIGSMLPWYNLTKDFKQSHEKMTKAYTKVSTSHTKRITENKKTQTETVENIITTNINELELSYKTKDKILNLRKQYVNNSIFADKNYEPSEAIFGQIIDGKPWVSDYMCEINHKIKVDGFAKQGIVVANPQILVSIMYPFTFPINSVTEDDRAFCNAFTERFKPISVQYDKSKNELQIRYPYLAATISNSYYQLNGINARDLGYKYVYLDKNRTTANIDFVQPNNLSNEIVEFQDYFHLGSSCRIEGGCNNISPIQNKLQFYVKNEMTSPAQIYLKLWKNKPFSQNAFADINVVFIF